MARNDLSVDVKVNLSVANQTVDRCLRILEMWLEDNPQYDIVGERQPIDNGERIVLKVCKRDS